MFTKQDRAATQAFESRVKEGVAELEQSRRRTLEDMMQSHVISTALMHREIRRLTRKFGENHPRVRRLQAGIQQTSVLARSLQAQLEISRIGVPETPEGGSVVHGRVMDEHGRGYMGLMVSGEDDNCKPVCALGTATTDSSGYFAIQLSAELMEKLGKVQIFLVVKTKSARALKRQEKPLTLTPDGQRVVEIVLERKTLWPKTGPGQPAERKLPPKKGK